MTISNALIDCLNYLVKPKIKINITICGFTMKNNICDDQVLIEYQ